MYFLSQKNIIISWIKVFLTSYLAEKYFCTSGFQRIKGFNTYEVLYASYLPSAILM